MDGETNGGQEATQGSKNALLHQRVLPPARRRGAGLGQASGLLPLRARLRLRTSAEAESDHLVNAFKPYVDKAFSFLDWGMDALNLGVSWTKRIAAYVIVGQLLPDGVVKDG